MKERVVYVVLRQLDESMPPDVVGVYQTPESANTASEAKGCWVEVSELRV